MSFAGLTQPGVAYAWLAVSGLLFAFACGEPFHEGDSDDGGNGGALSEDGSGRGSTAGGNGGGPVVDPQGGEGIPLDGASGDASSAPEGGEAGAGGGAGTVCENGERRCSTGQVLEVCADDRATFVQERTCSGAKPICDALAAQCVGCERCNAATQVCNNYQCECKRSHTGADCSQPRFQLVGSTVDYGFGVGASGDGAVIVGTTYDVNEAYSGFAWTLSAGIQALTAVAPDNEASLEPHAVSKNGKVIVGTFDVSPVRAFRWTESSKAVALGVLPGASSSYGYASNADGSVIVGASGVNPFRWTSNGMVPVPLGANNTGGAAGVNDDGTVVVGTATMGGKASAYCWKVGETVATALGTFVGATSSSGHGVSGDGLVVVGSADNKRAFRWSSGTGFVGIADSVGGSVSTAKAANIDGTVIVGSSDRGAWVWDSELGLRMVEAIVADLGFVTDGYDFRTLNAVSSDGRTIVGGTSTPSGIDRTFVVRLP